MAHLLCERPNRSGGLPKYDKFILRRRKPAESCRPGPIANYFHLIPVCLIKKVVAQIKWGWFKININYEGGLTLRRF